MNQRNERLLFHAINGAKVIADSERGRSLVRSHDFDLFFSARSRSRSVAQRRSLLCLRRRRRRCRRLHAPLNRSTNGLLETIPLCNRVWTVTHNFSLFNSVRFELLERKEVPIVVLILRCRQANVSVVTVEG